MRAAGVDPVDLAEMAGRTLSTATGKNRGSDQLERLPRPVRAWMATRSAGPRRNGVGRRQEADSRALQKPADKRRKPPRKARSVWTVSGGGFEQSGVAIDSAVLSCTWLGDYVHRQAIRDWLRGERQNGGGDRRRGRVERQAPVPRATSDGPSRSRGTARTHDDRPDFRRGIRAPRSGSWT